jgi:hypothetical protein
MTLRMGITRRQRGTALTSAPRPGHELGVAVIAAMFEEYSASPQPQLSARERCGLHRVFMNGFLGSWLGESPTDLICALPTSRSQ